MNEHESKPYPHPGGCRECREARACNVCGDPLGPDRCTNGRCRSCHAAHCAPGGSTTPGHGFGKIGHE